MSAVTQPAPINEDKMNAFLGKVVGDFGAALSSSLVYIGQKTRSLQSTRVRPGCYSG